MLHHGRTQAKITEEREEGDQRDGRVKKAVLFNAERTCEEHAQQERYEARCDERHENYGAALDQAPSVAFGVGHFILLERFHRDICLNH
ncbi:hypothetical protein ES703_55383 [subsurface metagenome]